MKLMILRLVSICLFTSTVVSQASEPKEIVCEERDWWWNNTHHMRLYREADTWKVSGFQRNREFQIDQLNCTFSKGIDLLFICRSPKNSGHNYYSYAQFSTRYDLNEETKETSAMNILSVSHEVPFGEGFTTTYDQSFNAKNCKVSK
jgi:hypothetical protein